MAKNPSFAYANQTYSDSSFVLFRCGFLKPFYINSAVQLPISLGVSQVDRSNADLGTLLFDAPTFLKMAFSCLKIYLN